MLTDLTIKGKSATVVLDAAAHLSAELTYSQRQTTNLLLTIVDRHDHTATKALYAHLDEEADCTLNDLTLRPDTLTTGGTDTAPTCELSFKVRSIAALEKRTGGKSWGNTDVSAWAKAEIAAVDAKILVQPGLGEREIERKEPEGDHEKPESSHDVLANMAKQVGAWYFDTGQAVVLARPSWLVSQPGMPKYDLLWDDWHKHSESLVGAPQYRVDFNARPWEGRETLTFAISDTSDNGPGHQARPGNIVNYTGKAAPLDPLWIITEVRIPDHHDQPVQITCWRPVDPPEIVDKDASGEGGEGGEAGVPTGPIGQGGWAGEQLKNAAEIVREGQRRTLGTLAYELAVMTSMGESSLLNKGYGDNAVNPDGTMNDSVGLFQQQERFDTGGHSRSDRLTPSKSAGIFYAALVKTNYKGTYANGGPSVVHGGNYGGSPARNASLAVHNVQRNQDPHHYARLWADAQEVVKACIAAGKKSSGGKATGPLGKRIDELMSSYDGRAIDFDKSYGLQCADVGMQYANDLFGIPMVIGNGKDYWRHPALMGKFIPIKPSQNPRKGDLSVWGAGAFGGAYGPYGHVAIYSHTDRGVHYHLSQNPGVARVQPLSHVGLLGYMRPVRSE